MELGNLFSVIWNYIIPFVIMISVIIFIHELGHFVTAKKFGVYCGEFSIGMGPVVFKKQRGETQYSLRAIPIGGFVSMAGESDDTKADVNVPLERTINGISPLKRIVVMLAGIFMNVLLAWVIFIGISMYQGTAPVPSQPVLAVVDKNSPAQEAGLKEGDQIVSITRSDGKVIKIDSATAIIEEVGLYHETTTFNIIRDGKSLDKKITPKKQEDGSYTIGVGITSKIKKIQWYESFKYGTQNMVNSSTLIVKSLGTLVQGKNWDQVSGPVGIVKAVGETASNGFVSFLSLLAILSLNIGIFNAIPIPALDGGRALITVVEMITGKTVKEKTMERLITVGFILLFGIMLFATWNDILKLFI